MLEKSNFKKQLQNSIKLPENYTYLLAVSGGVDSMVLTTLFDDFEFKFQVAHINYKLRGKDSDLDQKLVEDFCKKNKIKFHLYTVSEKDNTPENSIQLWARDLRYRFFREIQQKERLDYLVTAHHLNDQLETFLINLSKASGIKGLSGIPINENKILRPLLQFSKDEIYDFAKKNNVEFREDLSNKKSDYLRNKIRNEIVPKLLETNDHFLENFRKSLSFLNETKDFVQKQIAGIEKKISVLHSDHIILDKEKLNLESDFVKFEILKKYGFSQTEEIPKIFKAKTGSSFFSENHHLTINRNQLIIKKINQNKESVEEIILTNPSDFHLNQANIDLSEIIEVGEFNWDFDAEKITLPLKLRKKVEGDLFYPIGFSGKKKVSKFFKDEKLSLFDKEKTWLLCDAENQILGIIPYRQDRRFSADKNTTKLLKILWIKEKQML